MTKLLEGIVSEAKDDLREELRRLRDENSGLRRELDNAVRMMNDSRDENGQLTRAISKLRRQLGPLYEALQLVFGEIETIPLGEIRESSAEATSTTAPFDAKSAIWESWKQKLPGAKAAIIDALLQHGELSVEQLCVMTHISRKQTIYDAANALKKIHLINGNNGRYSLKQI